MSLADLERRASLLQQGLLSPEEKSILREDVITQLYELGEDPFEGQRTLSGQALETGKGFARGFAGLIPTIGEGLAEQADALTNFLGAEDLIDSGEDNELVRLSRDANRSLQEKLGGDIEYRDQFMTKFGEGLGSFASFVLPGGALKLLGAPRAALGATTLVTSGAGAGEQAQRIDRARDEGIDVTSAQEDAAILGGSIVGLSELAPVSRVLSKITKAAEPGFKKGIANKVKSALVTGGVEGVQEVAASILQDAVERGVYNEDLPFNDSLMDDFTVGGAVGAFADLAVSSAAGRARSKGDTKREKELREITEIRKEDLREQVSAGQAEEARRSGLFGGMSGVSAPVDPETPQELVNLQETLDKEMAGAGLSDVKANILHGLNNTLLNKDGQVVFGIRPRRPEDQDVRLFGGQGNVVVEDVAATPDGFVNEGVYSNATGQIFLAADSLSKDGTIDQQRDQAVGILKHEQLHAMRALDLFTDAEWNLLTKTVNKRNKKGTSQSYMSWANENYSDKSESVRVEEAVAEMTRDARADSSIVTGKPRSLIQRIIDFFPKLNNFIKGQGFTSFESLVRNIEAGKVGKRERGQIRTLKNLEQQAETGPRQEDFGSSQQINQEEREQDFTEDLDERESRIFSDVELDFRDPKLTERFLESNDYQLYVPDGGERPSSNYYTLNDNNSISAYTRDPNRKSGFEQKTFKNPTLETLINWSEGLGGRPFQPRKEQRNAFLSTAKGYELGTVNEDQLNTRARNLGLTEANVDTIKRQARKELQEEGFISEDMFSRRKSSTPVESAVDIAKNKFADYSTSVEEEFFGVFWPRLMEKTKGTVGRDKVRVAAKRSVQDINEFVSKNPKYRDYYSKDRKATKAALQEEFNNISDEDLQFYFLANGLNSPATSLPANVGDALNFLSLYRKDGNLDAVELGIRKKLNKKKKPIESLVIKEAPFQVSGTTGSNKARAMKVVDRLIKENSDKKSPIKSTIKFLKEEIDPKELQAFNKKMGYKSAIPDMKAIKSLVKQATGQDQKIPRMFIFGKKVGAYTLNLLGESKYTTIDVWESRLIRSYFDGLFKDRTGVPKVVDEDLLFQDFSDKFKQEYEKIAGQQVDPSTLQAMRWFYIIDATKKAGYQGASTNETISELTARYIEKRKLRGIREDSRRQGDTADTQGVRDQEQTTIEPDRFSRRKIDAKGQTRDRDRGRDREDRRFAPLEGSPDVEGKGPIPEIVIIAEEYAERNGIPYERQPEYVDVDPELATRIADAYDKMPHDPQNPEVKEAYRDLIKQTRDQYDALVDNGYSFTFFDGASDPYTQLAEDGKIRSNPWNAFRDLRYNKSMAVYGTYDGYGTDGITGAAIEENPMLEDTGLVWKDQDGIDRPVVANDLFRAVHDAFGHGVEGAGFRARGEENAWQAHARLFAGPAVKAITSETRGQNSWLNYGPYGEHNQTASLEDTIFAEQKTGVMPSFTWEEGVSKRSTPETKITNDLDVQPSNLTQKVARQESKIEQVVKKNTEDAEKGGSVIPRFSNKADPESQYIAQNPDQALDPDPNLTDMFSRRKRPDMSDEAGQVVDRIVKQPAPRKTPGQTYLENTDQGTIGYMLTRFKQAAINKYARLEEYSRDPIFKDNLADTSAIASAYFADRSMGITASALKSGAVSYENGITRVVDFFHNGKKYSGLIDVMAPLYDNQYNVSLEDLAQSYAIARRTEDKVITRPDGSKEVIKGLRSRGIDSPVKEGDLERLEAEIDKYTNAEGNSIVREWYDVWQAYNGQTVKFLKSTGVIDDTKAQEWLELSDYIPFYRQAEAKEGEIVNLGSNVPVMFKQNMTTAIKLTPIRGSEKSINVPMLDAITRNLSMAIDAGMKNVAQQRIVRDMIKVGVATKATPAQKKNKTQNFVVDFKVNGVDQSYVIADPLLYESMQTVGDTGGIFTEAFGIPSRFLRELVTRDPGFMLANMMRDTLSAYVTSGADFTPVIDTLVNLGSDIDQLERFGVVGGYDFSNDPDDMVKAFAEHSRKRGININGSSESFVLKPFKAIWNTLGQGTTISDAATRKAVYNDVLARTGNEAEAAFQALEVINFSRRGRNPFFRFLTTAIPFLNARFQGLDVLYRGFMGYNPAQRGLTRGEAVRTALTRGSLITASTLMYWLLTSDDEEYKKATDEQRDLNWLIPTGTGVPIRIPVPFEVGLIFKTIPERIFDTYPVAEVFGKTGQTSKRELTESVTRGVVSTLEVNPFGMQLFAPIAEASLNYNFFTGGPVVPVYTSNNAISGLLSRESNTEISKVIGKALNISPIKIDHVLYGYTGTIGGYIIDSVDQFVLKNPKVTGDPTSAAPSMAMSDYPIVKRFLLNKFSSGDQQDFYRLRTSVQKFSQSMKRLEEDGRYGELEAMMRSQGHLLDIKDEVNVISRRLGELRRERTEVEKSNFSPEEKEKMIQDIQDEMNYYVSDIPELKKYANLPAFSAFQLTGTIGE